MHIRKDVECPWKDLNSGRSGGQQRGSKGQRGGYREHSFGEAQF